MDPLVPTKELKESITVTPDEIVYSVASITTLSLVTRAIHVSDRSRTLSSLLEPGVGWARSRTCSPSPG